jgi:hypothetical protein
MFKETIALVAAALIATSTQPAHAQSFGFLVNLNPSFTLQHQFVASKTEPGLAIYADIDISTPANNAMVIPTPAAGQVNYFMKVLRLNGACADAGIVNYKESDGVYRSYVVAWDKCTNASSNAFAPVDVAQLDAQGMTYTAFGGVRRLRLGLRKINNTNATQIFYKAPFGADVILGTINSTGARLDGIYKNSVIIKSNIACGLGTANATVRDPLIEVLPGGFSFLGGANTEIVRTGCLNSNLDTEYSLDPISSTSVYYRAKRR